MKQTGNMAHWEEDINHWKLFLKTEDLLDEDSDIIVSNTFKD